MWDWVDNEMEQKRIPFHKDPKNNMSDKHVRRYHLKCWKCSRQLNSSSWFCLTINLSWSDSESDVNEKTTFKGYKMSHVISHHMQMDRIISLPEILGRGRHSKILEFHHQLQLQWSAREKNSIKKTSKSSIWDQERKWVNKLPVHQGI